MISVIRSQIYKIKDQSFRDQRSDFTDQKQ